MKESLEDVREVKKLTDRKRKGNSKDRLIKLYYDTIQELRIPPIRMLCPAQLLEIISIPISKLSDQGELKEEEEFLFFLIIKMYHLVRKREVPEIAVAILNNLQEWLLHHLDSLKVSLQVLYDLLSEYYRLSLAMTTATGPCSVAVSKQIDWFDSHPHSRISTELFLRLDSRPDAAEVQREFDRFLPRIRNGIWMKCKYGHYYCIPVTQRELRIQKVHCCECTGKLI